MSEDDPSAQLTALFSSMGADERQGATMARQTLKRAAQLSQERGISELEALEYLLRVIVAGRSGETLDPPERKNL